MSATLRINGPNSGLAYVHRRMKGDTQTKLRVILYQPRNTPFNLASLTVKVIGYDSSGTAWITEGTTGVTAQATSTFTAATTDWITANDHDLRDGDQLIVSNSGGALPAGLAASTRYFVRDSELNRFKVSLSPGGAIVDITDTGTGTHSFYRVGQVDYDFQTGDVDTAGRFKLWFRPNDGSSEYLTFPPDNAGIEVTIEEVG